MPFPACIPFSAFLLIALASCGGQSVESYIADLSHPDSEVRLKASYELVLVGAPAVESLLAHAATGSDSLHFISAQVLGRIGDKRAIPLLRQLAHSPNDFVRREAVLSLGKMGDLGIGPFLLVTLVGDKAAGVRGAAAQSLGNLRDTLAVLPLVQSLEDSAALVRQQAVAALHRLWTPTAEAAIVGALQDRDETVRYIAAQSLGKHRLRPALAALRTALRDTSVWVRAESARALGGLGDTSVVDDLVRLLKQHDGPDHQAAREALQELTGLDYVVVQ
jgi:HEAT repeat protein